MRCYLMRNGHIASVEEFPGLSDEDATAKAHLLFSKLKDSFESFELWDRSRVIMRYPEPIGLSLPERDEAVVTWITQ
jgi:hypothetical protein